METITSKKEFKKKCKAEKAGCYRLSLIGSIIAIIGLIIVLIVLILDSNTSILPFPTQLVGYWLGAAIAVVGGVLDLVGEIRLNQEFKAQL